MLWSLPLVKDSGPCHGNQRRYYIEEEHVVLGTRAQEGRETWKVKVDQASELVNI